MIQKRKRMPRLDEILIDPEGRSLDDVLVELKGLEEEPPLDIIVKYVAEKFKLPEMWLFELIEDHLVRRGYVIKRKKSYFFYEFTEKGRNRIGHIVSKQLDEDIRRDNEEFDEAMGLKTKNF